jgi:hypothetical protein
MTESPGVTPKVSWPLYYRIVGRNANLARQFSEVLHSCGLLPSPNSSSHILIDINPAIPAGALSRPCTTMFNWRDLSVSGDAERIRFHYQAWQLELDMRALAIKCWGPDAELPDPLNFREFFLLTPLLFLMHRFGYFEMHAAACVLEERGYMFVGPSGSGKTSNLLSLIALGAKYLSDDAVVISPLGGGGVEVRGLRRSFSLKLDYLQHDPELASRATEFIRGAGKRRIDPRRIWPAQYAPAVRPQVIILCKIENRPTSEIVPVSKTDALARLIAATPWIAFDQSTAADHLRVFCSLVEGCHTFELRAGQDIFRNGTRLASLLATKAPAC